MSLIDMYVRDKHTGEIHRVGDDEHDAICVNENGTVIYVNLQNRDGTREDEEDNDYGYEFVRSIHGVTEITRQDEFLKMFPYAECENGVITVKPCTIDSKNYPHMGGWCNQFANCNICRRKYWLAGK